MIPNGIHYQTRMNSIHWNSFGSNVVWIPERFECWVVISGGTWWHYSYGMDVFVCVNTMAQVKWIRSNRYKSLTSSRSLWSCFLASSPLVRACSRVTASRLRFISLLARNPRVCVCSVTAAARLRLNCRMSCLPWTKAWSRRKPCRIYDQTQETQSSTALIHSEPTTPTGLSHVQLLITFEKFHLYEFQLNVRFPWYANHHNLLYLHLITTLMETNWQIDKEMDRQTDRKK